MEPINSQLSRVSRAISTLSGEEGRLVDARNSGEILEYRGCRIHTVSREGSEDRRRVQPNRARQGCSAQNAGDAREILRWKERFLECPVEWSGLEMYMLLGAEPTAIFKRTDEIFFTRNALRQITSRRDAR